jgi:hypothetical protein
LLLCSLILLYFKLFYQPSVCEFQEVWGVIRRSRRRRKAASVIPETEALERVTLREEVPAQKMTWVTRLWTEVVSGNLVVVP